MKIVRPESLANLVFEELERAILAGELSPGEPVNEKVVAERLAVSRGPVREACRRLEQAGLVTSYVNRGVFVRKLTAEDAGELFDLRALLSAQSGKLAARNVTDREVGVLRDCVERMEEYAEGGDVKGYYDLNAEYHRKIFEYAGNRRMVDLYAALSKELHLFRWRALAFNPDLRLSLVQHREILDALAAHDEMTAANALETHSLAVKTRVLGAGLGD